MKLKSHCSDCKLQSCNPYVSHGVNHFELHFKISLNEHFNLSRYWWFVNIFLKLKVSHCFLSSFFFCFTIRMKRLFQWRVAIKKKPQKGICREICKAWKKSYFSCVPWRITLLRIATLVKNFNFSLLGCPAI